MDRMQSVLSPPCKIPYPKIIFLPEKKGEYDYRYDNVHRIQSLCLLSSLFIAAPQSRVVLLIVYYNNKYSHWPGVSMMFVMLRIKVDSQPKTYTRYIMGKRNSR